MTYEDLTRGDMRHVIGVAGLCRASRSSSLPCQLKTHPGVGQLEVADCRGRKIYLLHMTAGWEWHPTSSVSRLVIWCIATRSMAMRGALLIPLVKGPLGGHVHCVTHLLWSKGGAWGGVHPLRPPIAQVRFVCFGSLVIHVFPGTVSMHN
jgi:hypothetical protein